ncbi:heme biosynthesis protein HemY [Labrys miyagiensis]|uniref:Heme biosynthesis protein HemY n=1 Tax=Labrys miyagiensis TaxID=346912 RepID=A0ABQ6CM47_9HYPH|nr:heme biosynthesis HemY N-terminal domain-containing protein [Labrys miyagiensis]GLS20910.1 heme biosynthesis protein HemY [Labrys miyagiensis]
MIRVVVTVVIFALVAYGLYVLADRPESVSLTFNHAQHSVKLVWAVVALIVIVALLMMIIGLARWLLRSPANVTGYFRTRRRSRGFNAVTQGMIAVGSGDVRRAQKQANDAERILGREPLALLLRAQASQLSGDRAGAETAFRAMLNEAETKPLGLRGLFVEARRRGDAHAARLLAAEAVKTSPSLPWAGTALLEFQSVEKDWAGALATLGRNADHRLIDKETARRHRAVLLTARAIDQAERDRAAAKASALEALKLAPGLVPAAVLAAKLLSESNDIRKAARVLETAWRVQPHPDLAEAYMNVRLGDSARDRYARVQHLAALMAGNPEASIALARAALSARDFTVARSSLSPLLASGATERVCLLMAEIEEAENGATGKVREWLSRALRAPRDPVWTADGVVSDVWLPVSPVTGRIDAFEWKTPVERLGAPVMSYSDDVLADIDEPEQPKLVEAPAPAPTPVALETPKAAAAEPVPIEPAKVEVLKPEPLKPPPGRRPPPPMPVVPSHPVPDDPGTGSDEANRVVRFPING